MDWGIANRMQRIIRPETGRTVMLAIDHGYFLGPTSGLEEPGKTVEPLLPHADSLMLTRGTLRRCIPPTAPTPIVLRVSGGTSILSELSHEGLTVAMEDAIRLNAAAVTLSIFVGAEGERETLLNLARLVDEGERYGIPVLAVTAVGKEMTRDARYLGLACRISAELGAHMVKTYYCEGFEHVVGNTPVPIVVAGGKKIPEKDAVRLARDAVAAGACGVDMGRNIFQSDCPVGMIRAVRAVVQQDAGVEDAFGIYLEEKSAPVRVAVYHANDDVRLEERPRPVAGSGELLLRVKASGICGSDVMEWYRKPRAPLVLGHEVAGTVEEVGEGVTDFRVGDRIVTTHHVPCNRCRYCLTDRHSVCPTLHSTSFDPGGFAEFVRLPAINVERGTFSVPAEVSFEAASFVEPLACCVRSQRLAGLRAGDSVAVLGSGLSGLLQLMLARALGAARVYATDAHDYRVQAACAFGADLALAASPQVVERILAANGGRGVERVLVCTAARQAMQQAVDLVDTGGTILYFAPVAPGENVELPLHDLWKRGVSIVHSYAGPPADMLAALDLIASGRVDVEPMITHRLGLAETGEGFRLTAEAGDSLKVIVDPGR